MTKHVLMGDYLVQERTALSRPSQIQTDLGTDTRWEVGHPSRFCWTCGIPRE